MIEKSAQNQVRTLEIIAVIRRPKRCPAVSYLSSGTGGNHKSSIRQTVAFFKIAEGRHTVLIDWICTFIGKLFFHYTHTTPQFSNIPNWQQNIPKNILTKPN